MTGASRIEQLVASPCCRPDWSLQQSLAAYAALGFTRFEGFTEWTAAALDPAAKAATYARLAAEHGMRFASLHLPTIRDEGASLERAIHAAGFAEALGAEIVVVKAESKELYARAVPAFLAATDALNVTPVIENHKGAVVSSLADYRDVLEAANDARLRGLLEVGHFHCVGVGWKEAYDLLRGRIALVHLKDIAGGACVPFGAGEVDFPGLLSRLKADGYAGGYVVELEGDCRRDVTRHLRDAIDYLRPLIEG
jgi:sugar phosphate isomerase/epimerase